MRSETLHGINGGATVGRVGDDLEAALLQQRFERLPQHEVVVREDQPYGHPRLHARRRNAHTQNVGLRTPVCQSLERRITRQ